VRHRLPLLLLAFVYLALGVASCEPAASPAALAPSAAPSATALPDVGSVEPALPSRTPTATYPPTVLPTATASPTLTPTPIPSPTPTLNPTPTPTLPPVRPPAADEAVPLALEWWRGVSGHLTDGAVITRAGQPLFVATSLGRAVYAFNTRGEVQWQVRTAAPAYSLAPLDGQRLAFGDDAGRVIVLDASGRKLWQYEHGGRITGLAASGEGLVVGSWDGRLSFLDTGGNLLWQADVPDPVSAVAILPDLVLAATGDGSVLAFDVTGTEVWRFDAGAPITHIEAGEEAGVLAGTQDGRLIALDTGGALRWQQVLGQGAPVWHASDLEGDTTSEIVAGTGGDEPILALLSGRGEVLWRVAVPSPVGAITALDLDRDTIPEILAGLASGEIQAYDIRGHLRASVHAGLPVWRLEAESSEAAFVLADVLVRRIVGDKGPSGGPWLPPPPMLRSATEGLPPRTERRDGEAILTFLGDVALGRSMETQLARYGPAYPWVGLDPLLQEADLAVANLECVLAAHGEPLNKRYLIRAHPRNGQALAAAGIDLVTVANNHALDYGQVGLEETLDTLDALDIAAVGTGRASDAAQPRRPAIFTVKGVRVAILGYAAARWDGSVDVPATDRIAWARPAAMRADVRAVREQVDVVVVLLHAGVEYAPEPSSDQVAVARAAVDAGADLVVGHHPHVTQTVERYGDGLIVYSLGDALFDIPRPAAMQGDLLRVHVTKEGLVQAELWPFWIEDAIRPRLLDDGQGKPRFEIVYP